DFVWNILAPSRYKSLERLQTRALRIIPKDSNLSRHQLLCQLSWKSLKARSNMHNLSFSSDVYSTRRNGLDILIPKVRTESAKTGTFYSGAQAFNDLPPHLKEVDSLAIFKTQLND
ncbi:unnamed protein product, partial [Pocillopora meandrina]